MTHLGRLLLTLFLVLLVYASSAAAELVDLAAEGVAAFEAEAFEEAKVVLIEAVESDPGDSRARFFLGRTYLELLDADNGLEQLEAAATLESGSSEYARWLGRAHAQKAMESSIFSMPGRAKKSLAAIERAIKLDPDNIDARVDRAQYFVFMPRLLGGSVKTALAEAEEIKRRDASRGHMTLGMIRRHRGELDAAEAEYRAVLARDREHVEALYELGVLLQSRERWAEAVDLFSKALAADPELSDALYQLGKTSAISGLYLDEGERHLKIYREQPPRSGPGAASASWRLGMIREHQGDMAGARAEYHRALEVEPEHREAKKALRRLRRR